MPRNPVPSPRLWRQSADSQRTLPVRWLTPQAAAFLVFERGRGVLPVPVGDARIEAFAPDGNALVARGTVPALDSLSRTIAALDQPATDARLEMRLVRCVVERAMVRESQVMRSILVTLRDGEPVRRVLSTRGAIGFTAEGSVRIDGQRVLASIALLRGRPRDRVPQPEPTEVPEDRFQRLAGWTDDPDPERRSAVSRGQLGPEGKAATVFYLDVRRIGAPRRAPDGSRRDLLPLAHLRPAEALTMLARRDRTPRVDIDTARRALVVDGPLPALGAVRAAVEAMDRKPAPARILMRVVRLDFPLQGAPKESVLREETRETVDGAVEITDPIAAWTAEVRVFPQPDGSAWVFGEVRSRSIPKDRGAAPVILRGGSSARLKPGRGRRMGGAVRTDDPKALDINPERRAAAEAIGRGDEPVSGRPIAAIVLDAVLLSPPPR